MKVNILVEVAATGLGFIMAAGAAWAHEGEQHGKAAKAAIAVTGEVIDIACYTQDGDRGAKHAQCAADCARKGIPLGLLDAQGRVYVVVTAKHEPGAALLMPYVAGKVRATGKVFQRGGVRLLTVDSVDPVP